MEQQIMKTLTIIMDKYAYYIQAHMFINIYKHPSKFILFAM
jgi:hypothetical protein